MVWCVVLQSVVVCDVLWCGVLCSGVVCCTVWEGSVLWSHDVPFGVLCFHVVWLVWLVGWCVGCLAGWVVWQLRYLLGG